MSLTSRLLTTSIRRGYLEGTGGEVVQFDRYTQDREALCAQIAAERGMTIIPPYDHPDVIAAVEKAAFAQARAGATVPVCDFYACVGCWMTFATKRLTCE